MRCPDLPGIWRSCPPVTPSEPIPPAFLDAVGFLVVAILGLILVLLMAFLVNRD